MEQHGNNVTAKIEQKSHDNRILDLTHWTS